MSKRYQLCRFDESPKDILCKNLEEHISQVSKKHISQVFKNYVLQFCKTNQFTPINILQLLL